MAKLDLTVFKDELDRVLVRATDLGLKCLSRLKDIEWEPGDEVEDDNGEVKILEEAVLIFSGKPAALIELASFDHELHGAGFSFSVEEVQEVIY